MRDPKAVSYALTWTKNWNVKNANIKIGSSYQSCRHKKLVSAEFKKDSAILSSFSLDTNDVEEIDASSAQLICRSDVLVLYLLHRCYGVYYAATVCHRIATGCKRASSASELIQERIEPKPNIPKHAKYLKWFSSRKNALSRGRGFLNGPRPSYYLTRSFLVN